MGSIHEASCECGYSEQVTVGSTKAAFRTKATFPFFCKNCGLVAVNTAGLLDDAIEASCPHCNAEAIVQYGVPPVSLYDMRPNAEQFKGERGLKKPQAALQWCNREASERGHLCPACHKMSLTFSLMPSIIFD